MTATIIQECNGYRAYDENNNLIGACVYVSREQAYYNNLDDNWTCNPVDMKQWLVESLQRVYKNIKIIFG